MSMSTTFTKRVTDIIGRIDQGAIVTESELERNFLNIIEKELKARGLSPVIEQQRKIIRGRSDARIGGLVFEFKKPIRPLPELLAKKKQLDSYIEQYKQKNLLLRGILTDGKNVIFVDEEKRIIEQGKLEDHVWMLEAWVSALSMKVASPIDLKIHLGPASSVGKALIKKLFEEYRNHKTDPFIKESFEMWDGVYGCATNLNKKAIKAVRSFAKNSLDISLRTSTDVKEFLFVVQTYLSILMKLLVGEVAIQKNIISAASLEELLGEYIVLGYEKLSDRIPFLSRVFEYDTFYWFVDLTNVFPQLGRVISDYLLKIAKTLDLMDFTGVSTDLVKQMYQGFFDVATRRALGEFYTPDVLVDQVLDSTNYQGKEILDTILLDPACGSGTFLVRAIDRFISISNGNNLGKLEALKKITGQIIGIDIHPFAVAMAKVNYLLALGRLIDPTVRRRLRSLPIPIYWADSLARATAKSQFGGTATVRTVEIAVPVLGTFILPDPDEVDWDRLIDLALTAVDNNWSDERFLAGFPQDTKFAYKSVLLKFLQTFRDRKARGLDGRWLSTLRNFVVIDKMRNRCDFVVGNPPWVRIHNVNEDIRKELMGKFEVYKRDKKNGKVVGWNPKLKKTRVPFPQQIDYCMAFVEAGMSYLDEEGKLGFLITAKIMNALYANLLRKMLIEKTKILKIIDYSLSDKQFFEEATNYPMILAVRKTTPSPEVDTEVTMVAAGQLDWNVDQKDLSLLSKDVESPWCMAPPNIIKIFRTMQNGKPKLGDKYTVQMGVKTSANAIFLVRDFAPTATKGIATITNEGKERANIEEELLRPLVRGRDISAWDFKVSGHIVWTHDDVTGDVNTKLPKNALDYFTKYKEKLLSRDDYRKGQPVWTIFRVSKDKLKNKVGWGELSRTMETVLIPDTFTEKKLGKRRLITIQTVYSIVADSKDFGYLLAAFLNSTPVRSFITSFAARARGRYFRHISWTVGLIPLPKAITEGNMKDPKIKEIIKLSKRMHKCKGIDSEVAVQLDRAIAELYGISRKELDLLCDYLITCGVSTLSATS